MKLLLITAIKAFEDDIKSILKKSGVKSYSYKDVIGYRNPSELSSNWFANDMNEGESVLFYAFVKKENVDLVFDKVAVFNNQQESSSSIHLAVTNIERSN